MKIRAFNVFCEFLIVSLNIISASLDAIGMRQDCAKTVVKVKSVVIMTAIGGQTA